MRSAVLPPTGRALRLAALFLIFATPATASEAADLAQLWSQATALEAEGALIESARHFETVARRDPASSDACWRAARSYWRAGEEHVIGSPQRMALFERAAEWSARGLERNPRCGACALWRYASWGRSVEQKGLVWGARHARDLRALLDLGLREPPQHRDANGNTTLGNLYSASAGFYRLVPEWFWLQFVFGVRGDADRALDHIRRALAISPERIDYHVEHGAVLLCLGERRDDAERSEEGFRVLHAALAMPTRLSTDAQDQAAARHLIESPQKACGYSRIGFLDVDQVRDQATGTSEQAPGPLANASTGPPSAPPTPSRGY